VNQVREALRWARTLRGVFLLTIPLFIYALTLVPKAERSVSPTIVAALAVLSATDVMVAAVLRARNITPAIEALRTNPDDTLALGKWRSGIVSSFTHAETVALFGVLLKFLGASWTVAGPFFAVAVLLLVIWRPKLEFTAAA
jgi:hypothetical protein